MRRLGLTVLTILFFSILPHAWGLDQSRILDMLVEKGLDSEQVGMIIQDDNGKLFTLNETKQLKPASTMKILTAGTALQSLGKDFEFKTELLATGAVKYHVLRGSLYLKAGGDPTFRSISLAQFLANLKSQGIQSIDGNIVIDDSNYSDIHTMNMKSWGETPNPGNYPLFVNVDPPSNLAPGSRNWLRAKRRLRRLLELNENYVIYQNMTEPDLWTGQDFALMLHHAKIHVSGKVVRGAIPEGAWSVGSVSTPLTKVIHDMLKSSNNFYADMLIRDLAAEANLRPANVEAGMQFIYDFLAKVGVSHDDYSLNSGSGFTHRSYITAGALCSVLNYLRDEPEVSTVFADSLPIAGKDGTLRHRMRRTEAQGNIHAKTGYLGTPVSRYKVRDGVVALAGFATSSAGRNLTFVFLYNGSRSPNLVRSIFDKICVELVTDPEL
ncbi:MAG: D-alanyl-D-alanine carboxypeptidase/D-alanyl-D-alanine-endopeptidase [Acidobacteria bacterium]|nr:MAG: D-alanyl-D-alanine carboxypeptidase/D-alanyl-D-alanine-endopeptidase [Acidobacteriota bacterium]